MFQGEHCGLAPILRRVYMAVFEQISTTLRRLCGL